MFPKILHQTWRTKDLSAVEEFDACARTWRDHHPAYKYHLWDDEEMDAFVKSKFPSYYDTWTSFDKNIKRIDSIRYMWMYEYGGIYADLDMECLRSLTGLVRQYQNYDTILFCDLDADGQCISANPALMVSKPGSRFWFEILTYARDHREEYVTRCTGPCALGHVVNSCGADYRVKCLDQNRLFIRKHDKSFYTEIRGNEDDCRIYRDVSCTTAKPPKYYLDKRHKYVADWHGTPERFKWRNEYAHESNPRGATAAVLASVRRLLRFSPAASRPVPSREIP